MMMEQPEVPGPATVARVSFGRAPSDEVRASLEAVRVAQEAARLRGRRQTVRARIGLATGLLAFGLVALAFGPRMAARRHARPQAATTARPSPISPEPAAPAIGTLATEAVVADAPGTAIRTPEASDGSTTAPGPRPEEGCDTGLIRRAPWRLDAEACARAFDADPSNAALALAIAHAEHAHGSVTEAAQWAKRALSLDGNAAEAYVLIARGEAASGRRQEARAAYRRYLELAPRGWHRAEARAATRAVGTTSPRDPAGDR